MVCAEVAIDRFASSFSFLRCPLRIVRNVILKFMNEDEKVVSKSATKPVVTGLRGLYVVTDARAPGGHVAMARAALKGGARVVQLRDKTLSDAQLLPIAREIAACSKKLGALFLVNDRIELARDCGADGVHLGPDDASIELARQLFPSAVIGASCGTAEEARRAERSGADMIGAGAVFSTQTKSDAGAPIGLGGLREIVRATHLPVAAIGGLGSTNLVECLQTGAKMVCVVSAISQARDETAMQIVARQLVAQIERRAR